MKLEFSGKRVVILGGSCKLGLCLVKQIIKADLFPVLTYRNETGRQKIKNELKGYLGQYQIFLLDFSDRNSIAPFFDKINDGVDYLVDLVHSDFERLIASASEEDIYTYFEKNISFRAAVLKRTTRLMLKNKRGRLIFISSSSAAAKPNQGQGFYVASKLASEALYKNIGIELGKKGITTVSLRPGYIDAGRGKIYVKENVKQVLKKIPAGKILSQKEVAESIIFFLSKSGEGFNAVEISFDGGLRK